MTDSGHQVENHVNGFQLAKLIVQDRGPFRSER